MSLFNQIYESIRPSVNSEEQARKIADVLAGAIEARQVEFLTTKYLDLKVDYLDLKINSKASTTELKDLEMKMIHKYNLNTILVGVVTVASVAFGVAAQIVLLKR